MTYYGTRLSEHISRREPEGYLICRHVPVARTGTQYYLPDELDLPGGAPERAGPAGVPVFRPAEEVFDPACMASFEGMPVTDGHPTAGDGVTAENIRCLQRGHAQNVRRGTGPEADLLLADLVITDPDTVRRILDGKREISCGYNYTLCDEDGRLVQRNIRGNHIAVVDQGRAGPRVSIRDSAAKALFPAPGAASRGTFSPFPTDRTRDDKGGKTMNELKKNRGAMLRRMLVAFARDAEADPAEVAAAAGMIADLEEARPGTEAPVPAEPAREPETESADACRANSEDTEPAGIGALIAKADELLTGLAALTEALTKALTSRAADEDGEEPDREPGASDPAAEAERLLEAALAEDTEEPDEAAGAEEEGLLSDEDEPGEPVPAGDPAMAGMIRELMPVVAALPEETRREAADALLRAARKNAGLPPRAAAAPYAALRARKASDRLADPEALGRRIMATRNINMKKRA